MEQIKAKFLEHGYVLDREVIVGDLWGLTFSGEKYRIVVLNMGHELVVQGVLISDPEKVYTSMGSLFDYDFVIGLIEKNLG